MARVDGNYGKASLADLIDTMRNTPAAHLNYTELNAELQRRVAQMGAAKAQVWSALFQLGVMLVMFVTLIIAVA